MSDTDWTDLVVSERMQVDQTFNRKVAASNFSRQQWGLIMTAVDFDIEHPGDPEQAHLVADTSKVETVMPEVEKMDERGGMPGAAGGPGSGGGSGGSGGLFEDIKSALFGSGSGDDEQLAAAEELAQMYADDLQEKLEATGKWERVRTTASSARVDGSGTDEATED